MSRRSSIASKAGQRVLHLDAFSGIAGNMFAAALLDLGLKRKELTEDLAGIDVPHRLKISRVQRGALAARYFHVEVPGRAGSRKRRGSHSHAHSHSHSHSHTHSHGEGHGGAGDHGPHGPHGGGSHTRAYLDIVRLFEKSRLRPAVRSRALAIFEALGHAEAHVHGVSLDEVHFHEVGAVDAIVDVATAAIGLDRLGIQRVTSSPVALGHGTFESAHGRLPLPAPATLELLRGRPTVPAHVEWETVTPTGAAILRTIVDEYTALPAMTIEAIGIGAGNDRPGPMPNVLRAIMGTDSGGPRQDRISVLETNLDDLVPEHFDHLMERLFEQGALDVSLQNIQMKKNRPGFLVRVMTRPSDRDALARVLFAESTAIGVRIQEQERLVLEREVKKIQTPYGRIRVKFIRSLDGQVEVAPEYDDCKRAARRTQEPLSKVLREIESLARSEID